MTQEEIDKKTKEALDHLKSIEDKISFHGCHPINGVWHNFGQTHDGKFYTDGKLETGYPEIKNSKFKHSF